MATNPARVSPIIHVECTLHDDPRLMAGVAEIVANTAGRAGLSEAAQKDFTNAVADACREAFLLARRKSNAPAIKLVVADFQDRVEVTIEFSDMALETGADASGKRAEPKAGEEIPVSLANSRAAGVQCEIREGRFYVTHAKSNGAANSSGASKSERKI